MQSTNTVVLGEASESDSEEISLNDADEIQVDVRDEELDSSHDSSSVTQKQVYIPASISSPTDDPTNSTTRLNSADNKKGFSGWLPFAEASASSLVKLVTYTPYNLLTSTMQTTTHQTRSAELPTLNPKQEVINNLSLLHKNLYMKNQQLYACLDHAFKHPYVKASRDLNTISQRLVGVQRTIQEVEIGITNIKREQNNLDIKIDLIK